MCLVSCFYLLCLILSTGKNCEKCVNVDCKNGGVCVKSDSGHVGCQCTAGYRGLSCTQSDCDNYCIRVSDNKTVHKN